MSKKDMLYKTSSKVDYKGKIGDVHKNIILITVDCLRADYVSCIHAGSSVRTPNIDYFGEHGLVFKNAYSVSSWTYPSFFALHTSLYPSSSPKDFSLPSTHMLAEVLRENGYHTAAFISNPWLTKLHGFQRGFDIFCDTLYWQTELGDSKDKFLPYSHIRGAVANNYAIKWLQSVDSPFFIWLHYMELHTPIKSRVDRLISHFSKDLGRRKLYSRYVKVIDSLIGSLLSSLDSRLMDDCLIVITADHGEALGEQGISGHAYYLNKEIVHVPLIIVCPEIKHKVHKEDVSLIDLPSTILKLNGIDAPHLWHSGNLIEDERDMIIGEEYLADKKISHKEWEQKNINKKGMKYFIVKNNVHFVCMVHNKGTIKPQVCWKETSGLTEFSNDIKPLITKVMSHRSSMKKLRDTLKGHKKLSKFNQTTVEPSEEDEKIIRKRLRDLGYIE